MAPAARFLIMKQQAEEYLRQASFLQFLPPETYARVRTLFRELKFDFGETIVRQGEAADAFYVLVAGRARVLRTTTEGQEVPLNLLRAGDIFGESALLSDEPRNATVRCSTAVEVLRLDREEFRILAEEQPRLKDYLEVMVRWRTLHGFLYQFSNFGRLPKPALSALLERLESVQFSKGKRIITQGDPAGPLYIIQQGKVRIFSQKDGQARNLAFLREGDFFGELSVLQGLPRAASAEALHDCHLLSLSAAAVAELNREFPEFARLMAERIAQYQTATEARVPLDFSLEMLPAGTSVGDKLALDEPGSSPPPETDGAEQPDAPFEDEAGHFRKGKKRIRRMPFVPQIDEMDCGAASLAMVCRHFGRAVSLPRIRQLCHTANDGTSLRGICAAATELGLAARALKVSHRNLPDMPLPAIVHWEGNHWIVLFDVGPKQVRVADPAGGIRRIALAEFQEKWSGYAALFDYTVEFEKAPEGRVTLAWLWPFFRKFQLVYLQVLLLAGVVTVMQLLFPVFTQVIMDKVVVEHDLPLLNLVLAGLAASGLFMLASNLLQQYLLAFATVRIDSAVLDFLTRQLLALPMSYYHSRRTGDIQRRLNGAQQIRSFVVQHGIGGLLATVQLAGTIGLMMLYSLKLLGVFLVTVPLYAGLMYFSRKVLRPAFAELEECYGKYGSRQIDAIKGMEAVKAAAAEPALRATILNEFLGVARKTFRSTFIGMSYESMLTMISLVSTTLFLWAAAHMVLDGQLTVGGFVAFMALLAMANAAVLRALGIWDELQMVSVLLNRLNDIFEQEPEQGRDRSQLKPVPTLEGRIELRNVGFRYGGPEAPPILKGINLEIAAGKTVALVGRSGSGKTTLIKLLCGLLESTEGHIYFDRLDLKTLNYRDVRRLIGMVLQDNYMFDDTVVKNIAFGDPEPDFERVLRAAQLANAHDFISRLPLGYESKIGESGLAISGGQKQRIAIARAIYSDPPILIFDEATSALDTESERAIQANMQRFMAGRTSVVIAHRLSTIRDADLIVVLEKGEIAEQGTHDELMALKGLYFYLASQQLGM
jgi:HlyB family type I secretion system ABC transporter